jgi:hypothetical protein
MYIYEYTLIYIYMYLTWRWSHLEDLGSELLSSG